MNLHNNEINSVKFDDFIKYFERLKINLEKVYLIYSDNLTLKMLFY